MDSPQQPDRAIGGGPSGGTPDNRITVVDADSLGGDHHGRGRRNRGNGGGGSGDGGLGGEFGFGVFNNGKSRKSPPKRIGATPSGGGAATQSAAPLASVDVIAGALAGIHLTLAAMVDDEDMILDDKDAKMLARAGVDLLAQYKTTIDPRAMMWTNFLLAAGQIYGPRIFKLVMKGRAHAQAGSA